MKYGIFLARLIFSISILTVFFNDDGRAMTREVPVPIENYKGEILVKVTGGLARLKESDEVKTCLVDIDHPDIKERRLQIVELIHDADKSPIVTAFHFRAQVPSLEIYAIKVIPDRDASRGYKKEKVLLIEDYTTLKSRKGEAAKALIDIVKKICPSEERT